MAEFQFICERIKHHVSAAIADGAEPNVRAVAAELTREGLPSGEDVDAVIREHINRESVASSKPATPRNTRATAKPRSSHRGPGSTKKTKNKKRARKK